MAQQFKEYLDKETYLLFEEDGEKFRFSSNNPSVQKWCESVKNKKVKRDAVKFVVKAAKDYMKNPHQKEDFDRSPKPLADKVEAVDWHQENMVLYNFKSIFNLSDDKWVTSQAGYDQKGVALNRATLYFDGKPYSEVASSKKEAQRAVIYSILEEKFNIGIKSEKEKAAREAEIKQKYATEQQHKDEVARLERAKQILQNLDSESKEIIQNHIDSERVMFNYGRKTSDAQILSNIIRDCRNGSYPEFYLVVDGYTDVEVVDALVEDTIEARKAYQKEQEEKERLEAQKQEQMALDRQTGTVQIYGLAIEDYIEEYETTAGIEKGPAKKYHILAEDTANSERYMLTLYQTRCLDADDYDEATLGHFEITKLQKDVPYSYAPVNPITIQGFSIDPKTLEWEQKGFDYTDYNCRPDWCDYWSEYGEKMGNNVFAYTRAGGNEYSPTGGVSIDMDQFKPVVREQEKLHQVTHEVEFISAMDNPHFMERHFNKESLTIGSKPLPLAPAEKMVTAMTELDTRAKEIMQTQEKPNVIYLTMEFDQQMSTNPIAPKDCVEQGKIFSVIRDAGTPDEKEVQVALISKEDMPKTNVVHAIYGPYDEKQFGNYTAFFGAMSEPFPRELDKDATPEQIARNEKCKEYWDNHVFLATPEEVQKVVQDLQAVATKTEDKDKAQKYTTAATAASMRVNLFKNMGKKSPLTATYQANIEPYEIKVPQPKGNAHTRGGKSIGE